MKALHPLGPEPVVAFLVDGEGPYSLDSMIADNYCVEDEAVADLFRALRAMVPGDVHMVPIGGGATEVRCVFSPGFEFQVWNDTDGIEAAPEAFATRGEAENFVREFPRRFDRQGYYLTSAGRRISPEMVDLYVREVPVEEVS